MKKLIPIILTALMLSSCVSTSLQDEEISLESTTAIENTGELDINQYQSLSEELKAYFTYDGLSDYEEYSQAGFFDIVTDLYFMDIDDDDTYELLRCLHFNFPQGGHTIYLYDFIDGQVVCLGNIDGGAISKRYQHYYKDSHTPNWLFDEPIKIYRNSQDNTFKYLTYEINDQSRILCYNFTEFQISDKKVNSQNLNLTANYNISSDDLIDYKGWYYNFNNSSTDLEVKFAECLNDKFEGYEPFKPKKATLYTQLECNEWRNKNVKDELIAKSEYIHCVQDAIETISNNEVDTDNYEINDIKLNAYLNNLVYNDKKLDVECKEYYADYDGDKDNELFLFRYVQLNANTPDFYYRELWYIDGEKTEFVTNSSGRNIHCGVLEIDNGPDLFYYVPEIFMGASCQVAHCFMACDGIAKEYKPQNNNQFFAFDINQYNLDKNCIYILNDDLDDNELLKILDNAESKGEPLQKLSWKNGELVIDSGYGKKE